MGCQLTSLILCLLVLLITVASGSTVYVSSSSAFNDTSVCGKTETTACKTIQEGIDKAENGDIVQVSAGDYLFFTDAYLNFNGKQITVAGDQSGTSNLYCEIESGILFNSHETAASVMTGFTNNNCTIIITLESSPVIDNFLFFVLQEIGSGTDRKSVV